MSPKATVTAPANIAFVKYWGAKDLERAIPVNPSISMTLRECCTRSTVEFLNGETGDHEVFWIDDDGTKRLADGNFAAPVRRHLDRLSSWGQVSGRFRVATRNTFPTASGIASSASGFAALTLATVRALGHTPDVAELTELARSSGSGSAARSIEGGFVEWPVDETRFAARAIAGPDAWDLADVVAIVDRSEKKVTSRQGHERCGTSPFFAKRQELLPHRLEEVRAAIQGRDLTRLGSVLEEEAIELHLIAMSSVPPVFYWKPGTLEVLESVRQFREDGLEAYSTMDAGANVHVICEGDSSDEVARRLEGLPTVHGVIPDGVGSGPVFDEDHMF